MQIILWTVVGGGGECAAFVDDVGGNAVLRCVTTPAPPADLVVGVVGVAAQRRHQLRGEEVAVVHEDLVVLQPLLLLRVDSGRFAFIPAEFGRKRTDDQFTSDCSVLRLLIIFF